MKHIKTINAANLKASAAKGGCGKCQASCQSACKTSCTVSEPEVRALRVFENLSHASLQLIEERDSSVPFFASIHEFLWCCMFPKAAGKRKQNYDS